MNNADIIQAWDTYNLKLKNLTPEQVRRIDEYLSSVGDYGEVDLIVQHGELRYINRVASYKAQASDEEKK
ncbi:MAG: hypothetical protein HYR70_00500 [Chloroflexi bacterium]|nr:hypothetical protein [Chloroflexota bacterium]